MTAPSDAEEYDPATGTFRPIPRAPAQKPHEVYGARAKAVAASRPRIAGLSESGQKYGVFYEIFEHGLKSNSAKYLVLATKIMIAVIFALLVYEAVSYRLALG